MAGIKSVKVGLEAPLKGNILNVAGTYLTTSGTTELGLTKLSLTGITIPANGVMGFEASLRLSGGSGTAVAGDTFIVRVRQTTALSGTIRAEWRYIVPSANQASAFFSMPFVPTSGSVSNDSFHLSIVRLIGSGVLGVEGDLLSSFSIWYVLNTSVWSVVT